MAPKPKKAGVEKKKKKSESAGSSYGTSVQFTRVVAHFLRARHGESVSMEHLDDVATHKSDGFVVEQDKSGLAHNPIANRAVDLWKTLANWVRALRSGVLDDRTDFVIYVAQQHVGDWVEQMAKVTTRADALLLIASIREELWGKEPAFAKRSRIAAGLAEHVNVVLSASDDVLAVLIVHLSVERGSGSPNDDLVTLPGLSSISPPKRVDVVTSLLGWAKRTFDKCVENGEVTVFVWKKFETALVSAAKKFDRSDFSLPSIAVDLTPDEVSAELRDRLYVRQLVAVECEEEMLHQAVGDFLHSAIDRTRWSESGDVHEQSFAVFERDLHRAWVGQRARINIEQKQATATERGKLLVLACGAQTIPLQGMIVPPHFVPGSFHRLADAVKVGWHPDFLTRFTVKAPDPLSPSSELDAVSSEGEIDGPDEGVDE